MLSAIAARCQTSAGIFANTNINLIGSGIAIDSFNSSDPNHSIWQTNLTFHGMNYGVWSNSLSYSSNSLPSRTSDAVVATDGNILNAGNAKIYGYADTAPGGTVSIGANGSVGDLNWVYAGTLGVEPGHVEDNVSQVFYSKNLPIPMNSWQSTWTNVPSPPSGTVINIGGTWTNIAGVWTNVGGTFYTNAGGGFNIGGVSYSLVITNRIQNTNMVFYAMSSLVQNIFVDAPNVVLYLTNGMDYPGKETFALSTNADVQIYSTGNISVGGNSTINSPNGNAHALSIYDVSGSSINITFTAGANATALIYAPGSSMTFSGGISTYGFVGSIFCNSISVVGQFGLHFDESLEDIFPSPITQPILNGFFTPANGWFTCHLVGVTGQVYTIEASTNLVDWTPVWTNVSPFVFTETNMDAYPQRFYRSVFVP